MEIDPGQVVALCAEMGRVVHTNRGKFVTTRNEQKGLQLPASSLSPFFVDHLNSNSQPFAGKKTQANVSKDENPENA